MKAIFDHVENESPGIATFYFRPEKPVRYTAGQFTELTLPHPHPDARGTKRWFTLSSPPGGEFLTITTKFAADKGSTFKKTLRRLKPGAEVNLAAPMGDFVLPKLIQTPLVFVAAGMGVTPYHSILGWLADVREERPIKFLYAVHSEDDIIFQDTFRAAGVEPILMVSEPSAAWGGERGHLSADLILGLEKPSDDTLVYVSGPELMVQSLAKDLQRGGLNKHQIVSDEFPNYTAI